MEATVEYKFTPYLATGIAEGFEESESDEQVLAAWQYLVDSGLCWSLQGFFGRTASRMLENGILLPADSARLAETTERGS